MAEYMNGDTVRMWMTPGMERDEYGEVCDTFEMAHTDPAFQTWVIVKWKDGGIGAIPSAYVIKEYVNV